MSTSFHDQFSKRRPSATRIFRPRNPAALFDYLATLVPKGLRGLGGESAWPGPPVDLAGRFGKVIATDCQCGTNRFGKKSAPGVEYRVAPARRADSGVQSVAIVTVAQGPWFDSTVPCRVSGPGPSRSPRSGRMHHPRSEGEEVIASPRFYSNIVDRDWPPKRVLVEEGYRTIPSLRGDPTAPLSEEGQIGARTISATSARGRRQSLHQSHWTKSARSRSPRLAPSLGDPHQTPQKSLAMALRRSSNRRERILWQAMRKARQPYGDCSALIPHPSVKQLDKKNGIARESTEGTSWEDFSGCVSVLRRGGKLAVSTCVES